MHLYVWQGAACNFGDQLNNLLWPSLLPGLLNDGPTDETQSDDGRADLFLGIGSVLDARHPADRRKIVAGAGFGGYEAPASLDGSWEIYWVRGPRTARQLGLPAAYGLGDPASLLPLVHPVARHDAGPIGFMPHFESLDRGAWPDVAAAAGVTLIDPRNPPASVLDQIAGCRILLSEALHGVIVADALRIPWIALVPVAPIHRAKWQDWADSLNLALNFRTLRASSLRESIETTFTPRRRILRTAIAGAGALADRLAPRAAYLNRATDALRQAADAPPQLSDLRRLNHAQDQMLNRLQTLRADHAAMHQTHRLGKAPALLCPGDGSAPLRRGGNPRYDAGSRDREGACAADVHLCRCGQS